MNGDKPVTTGHLHFCAADGMATMDKTETTEFTKEYLHIHTMGTFVLEMIRPSDPQTTNDHGKVDVQSYADTDVDRVINLFRSAHRDYVLQQLCSEWGRIMP